MSVDRSDFVAIMSAFPTGVAIVTTLEPYGTLQGAGAILRWNF